MGIIKKIRKARIKTLLPAGILVAVTLIFSCEQPHSPDTSLSDPDVDTSINLITGQAASIVIGQPDFNTATSHAAGANTFSSTGINGSPCLIEDRLFISDFKFNRILVFNSIPSINNASSDWVLGQPDFTTVSTNTPTASNFNGPQTISYNGEKVALTDFNGNRILIWNTPPDSFDQPADVVVGQADFISDSAGTTANTLDKPESAILLEDKLIVSDCSNNRVLIYNTIPTTNNASADIVLGQPDFTSSSTNTTSSGMINPIGVWSDGNKLIVVDYANNRIMIWNSFPTANNTPADVVVGQSNFTTRIGATSQNGLNGPYAIAVDGKKLFVSDYANNRILIWNTIPTVNGTNADVVIGHSDFASNTAGTTQSRLNTPYGISVYDNKLFVTDCDNNRVLIFEGQ